MICRYETYCISKRKKGRMVCYVRVQEPLCKCHHLAKDWMFLICLTAHYHIIILYILWKDYCSLSLFSFSNSKRLLISFSNNSFDSTCVAVFKLCQCTVSSFSFLKLFPWFTLYSFSNNYFDSTCVGVFKLFLYANGRCMVQLKGNVTAEKAWNCTNSTWICSNIYE